MDIIIALLLLLLLHILLQKLSQVSRDIIHIKLLHWLIFIIFRHQILSVNRLHLLTEISSLDRLRISLQLERKADRRKHKCTEGFSVQLPLIDLIAQEPRDLLQPHHDIFILIERTRPLHRRREDLLGDRGFDEFNRAGADELDRELALRHGCARVRARRGLHRSPHDPRHLGAGDRRRPVRLRARAHVPGVVNHRVLPRRRHRHRSQ